MSGHTTIPLRPAELQLEGSIIKTSYGTGGRVVEVIPRKDGTYTIVYVDLRPNMSHRKSWINEVFVEGGKIYAHHWRDQIHVVEKADEAQLTLF